MQTECSANEIEFGRAGGRRVVADFDGGMVSSDAGALLLGETDKAVGLVERFSACFWDSRNPIYVVHEIKALIAQRVFGLASVTRTCSTMTNRGAIRFSACCLASSIARRTNPRH